MTCPQTAIFVKARQSLPNIAASSINSSTLSLESAKFNGATECQLTASNLAVNGANPVIYPIVSTAIVSGLDLTQYLLPASVDTPLERFLKEENGLQRMASSPWLCRMNKL